MNFQPPDPEDDPRDDDQRMQDAELEAHRVRFEQRYAKFQSYRPEDIKSSRRDTCYLSGVLTQAWQAYQWAIIDADRAQRAAPVGDAQPVAEFMKSVDVNGETCYVQVDEVGRTFTFPLYAAAQPVEVQRTEPSNSCDAYPHCLCVGKCDMWARKI